MNESKLREEICVSGKSMFDRGLTVGSSGNISVRLDDGWLMTPTNSCLGRLDPATLSKVDAKGNLMVPRVDTAIDCGFAVNPERIRSQIEGAAVMGLTLAKYGEITFREGRVEQSNFHDFQMVRADEAPIDTRVHIISNAIDVPASGVGEPGMPPFAPALCNAIFAATGKRVRRLPIGDQLAT